MSSARVTYRADAAELPAGPAWRGGRPSGRHGAGPARGGPRRLSRRRKASRRCSWPAHAGPPWALELPPQVDLLSLPAPMPMARCRLALALRMATLRRWLREPPLGAARSLLVDSLTGLYNHGAFLDYLRMAGEERALIGLEHDRLEWINRQAGYAAGNRGPGRARPSPCAGASGRTTSRRISAAAASPWRSRGRAGPGSSGCAAGSRRPSPRTSHGRCWRRRKRCPCAARPPQRLSRLFGDLRRLRPAA